MIKAVPKEGYALKTIAVTDQSGKPVAVTEKDGRFTFVMPACNVTLTPIFERQPAQNVSFDDVSQPSGTPMPYAVLWKRV